MDTIYRLNASEIDEKLIASIKSLFGDRKVVISVTDVSDETDYLLASETNRERLFDALENMRDNKNLLEFNSVEELERSILK
ncbi:MAG: hypothetical protein FJ213_11735 [Ignavibacteria bacterium]|nr:hypothetical protein [Ignavibacteria bacterium]